VKLIYMRQLQMREIDLIFVENRIERLETETFLSPNIKYSSKLYGY